MAWRSRSLRPYPTSSIQAPRSPEAAAGRDRYVYDPLDTRPGELEGEEIENYLTDQRFELQLFGTWSLGLLIGCFQNSIHQSAAGVETEITKTLNLFFHRWQLAA